MVNLVDTIRGTQQQFFAMFGRDAIYRLGPPNQLAEATMKMFLRGLKEEDLFAGAMQQDQVAILDANIWLTFFPSRATPMRLDRVVTTKGTYAVEQWRGAPNDDAPVFFKLLLRGGQQ
jgi:hypothetical protein